MDNVQNLGEKWNIGFVNCKMSIKLICQSPQIHFQHDQVGATLRGSELKPKLDKFLCRKMGVEYTKLDYKVRIECTEAPEIVEIGVNASKKNLITDSYSIYYGNMVSKEKKEYVKLKKGVWSNPNLIIHCFDSKLRELIEKNIVEFFAVTNFGTMQGKGFGSYCPQGAETIMSKNVKNYLCDYYDTNKCWEYSVWSGNNRKEYSITQFTWIKDFYSIMKSGRNYGSAESYRRSFIYQYMHKNIGNGFIDRKDVTKNVTKNINNEKAKIKTSGVGPAISKNGIIKDDYSVENAKYVRSLLGIGESQQWLSSVGDYKNKEVININHLYENEKDKIERIPSPVFFKIVGKKIFFIIKAIPDEVYDKLFVFSNKNTGKEAKIYTPSKDQFEGDAFDVEAFMSAYVKYYNIAVKKNDEKTIIEYTNSRGGEHNNA